MTGDAAAPWMPGGQSAHVDSFTRDHLPPRESWARIDYSVLPELAAYPARMNCATILLDRQAKRFGARPVLHDPEQSWSYDELLARANRIAHVLVDDLGVAPGNRVLLRGPNNPLYVACWFAVMKVGAVAVATMPLLRGRELVYMADAAEIEVALCDRRLDREMELTLDQAGQLAQVIYFNDDGPEGLEARMAGKPAAFENVDTAADDVCLIAFTSGTTGRPKGCMHLHRDILAICDTFSRYVLRPGPDDIFAGSPPIAFTFGLGALVAFPMHAGASTLLIESYTPETLLAAIEQHGVTILFTAPTMYRALTPLIAARAVPGLRQCVSAGEALAKTTWEGWHEASGIAIIDGIGTTEMLHMFISSAGETIRPGATGKPIPGYEAIVLDEEGTEVGANVVGRLAVRGPTACRYLADPERQAAYAQGGWNLTGDSYLIDEDGYFWYQARTDDMIISAGYNIAGPEIEAVLLEHPKVADCAVVAAPDPDRGEIVLAYVVARQAADANEATVQELQDHVKRTIAPYKYPRAIEFIDALPRTQTGKVQRYVLRERARAARGENP